VEIAVTTTTTRTRRIQEGVKGGPPNNFSHQHGCSFVVRTVASITGTPLLVPVAMDTNGQTYRNPTSLSLVVVISGTLVPCNVPFHRVG
jgi:hypothetical protein